MRIISQHAASAAQRVIELDSVIHLYPDQKFPLQIMYSTISLGRAEELGRVIRHCIGRREKKKAKERKMSGLSLLVYLLCSSHMRGRVSA